MLENRMLFVQVLPYRPAPYPGECLSGYLVRLADANGLTFWDLACDLFGRLRTVGQLPLLRWEYPIDEWGRIPLRTQLSPVQLRALSVAPLLAKFRAPLIVPPGQSRSPGQSLQDIVRPELAVCPQCLEAEPYVRLMWRLIPAQVCLTHAAWLQDRCPQCGKMLRVVSTAQPHLRCAECGMDLRRLPTVPAPEDLLISQTRCQANLQFLLNPETRLVDMVSSEKRRPSDLPQAIGLKFRYLRKEAGLSQADVAKRMKVAGTMVGSVENGRHTPLAVYLSYLDVFALTWSCLANLQVPSRFRLHPEPIHFSLRVCPNSDCPNHRAPSSRVGLEEDLPERQMARFRCATCGQYFTRTYAGQLVTKGRHSPIRPIHALITRKPPEECARVLKLGRQGVSNRRIHALVGWSTSTICHYWSVLEVTGEIHQAQVRRHLREKQERQAAVRARVDQALQSLIQRDEKITLERVGRELRCSKNYLSCRLGLIEHIRQVAQAHNPSVHQHREEALTAQLMQVLADLKQSGRNLTIREVAEGAGSSAFALVNAHPNVYATVRQAVGEHNVALQAARRQRELALVNEAAASLVARGIRLTRMGILKQAGLSQYRLTANPTLSGLLEHWVGDPISRT